MFFEEGREEKIKTFCSAKRTEEKSSKCFLPSWSCVSLKCLGEAFLHQNIPAEPKGEKKWWSVFKLEPCAT